MKKMKKNKLKIATSIISGVAIVGGVTTGVVLGTKHHISDKQFKQEENTDIYELSEMNKGLTSIAKMFSDQIVHPGK
jgi:hypothetical protein